MKPYFTKIIFFN